MYNDGIITTEFTGGMAAANAEWIDGVVALPADYADVQWGDGVVTLTFRSGSAAWANGVLTLPAPQGYESPSAGQNLVIRFPGFYLSAADNDFTDGGTTITTQTGDAQDITIGNAPAAVLTTTMLNPNGLMESLAWGLGKVYLGVITDEASADTYNDYACAVVLNGTYYGIEEDGALHAGATTYAGSGEPKAVVVSQDGTAYFYTDTGAYYFDGSAFSTAASNPFQETKYRSLDEPIGFLLDSNGCPYVINDVTNDRKATYTYVPMGEYDFSNADAHGITFGAEAYDQMTLFDADATDWVNGLDFATPRTVSWILSALMTEMGFTASVSASAVNTTLSFIENPFAASYAITYRQILRYIAEVMGCNARISRDGTKVELWTWSPASVQTITPNTVISNTRAKARYTVPQITEVVCYDTLGYNYASGVSGSTLYISANPLLTDLETSTAPLANLLTLLQSIPVYYPTTLIEMYADPRLDTGDFITLQDADGRTSYVVPVMHQTLTWNGVCKASLTANGGAARAIPSDLIDNNLSTTVNGRKILEGVDAKRITVLDEDENILFNADTETDEVYIAGFTVENDKFSYTKETASSTVAGENDTETVEIANGHISTSTTKWDDLGSGAFTYTETADISQGELHLTIDTTNDPDGGKLISTNIIGGMVSLEYEKGNVRRQVLIDPEAPHSIRVISDTVDSGGNYSGNTVWIGDEDIKLHTDSPDRTLTITASGPTPTSGYDQVSVPTGTAYHTVTQFDLEPGTYLVQIHFAFATNTSGRRVGIVSYSENSSAQISSLWRASAAPVNGENTFLNICGMVKPNSTTTFYLNAMQNSGSALNTFASWNYVRLA